MTNRDFVLWLKDYLRKVDEVPNWHILWSKLNSITDVQTYPTEDVNHLSKVNCTPGEEILSQFSTPIKECINRGTKLGINPTKVIRTHPRMVGEDGVDRTEEYINLPANQFEWSGGKLMYNGEGIFPGKVFVDGVEYKPNHRFISDVPSEHRTKTDEDLDLPLNSDLWASLGRNNPEECSGSLNFPISR